MSTGASLDQLGSLAIDAALAAGVLLTLLRSRDIFWFWPVHFMLDMAQFYRVVLPTA